MSECGTCFQEPREFPEDPGYWYCRCDVAPEEWLSGHLIRDFSTLFERLLVDEGQAELR